MKPYLKTSIVNLILHASVILILVSAVKTYANKRTLFEEK